MLATAGHDERVKLWDVSTLREVVKLDFPNDRDKGTA
jgi:WD40 repeat protein